MWKFKIRPLPLKVNPSELITVSDVVQYHPPDLSRSTIWGRVAITGGALGFGLSVLGVSAASVYYRLNYFTVDNAVVNGQTIELRSPIDGTVSTFETQPGRVVNSGQVLVRVKPVVNTDTEVVKLQGELEVLRSQYTQVQQTLVLLKTQLIGLDQQEGQFTAQQEQVANRDRSVNAAKVSAGLTGFGEHQALIDSAMAKAKAAQVEYDRYATLAAEGGISQQKVAQMKAIWQSAEADVIHATAAKKTAEATLETLREEAPVPVLTASNAIQNQRLILIQTIQEQTATSGKLSTEISAKQAQLKLDQANVALQSKDTELKAPSSGTVFQTVSSLGEQVTRSTPLLTVVDCKSRWIEAFIPANQASRINRSKPVQVQIVASGPKTPDFSGQIESLNGVNPDGLRQQSQAVFPIVPVNLNAQMPARVVVKLNSNQDIPSNQTMCGIGQSVKLTFSTQGS